MDANGFLRAASLARDEREAAAAICDLLGSEAWGHTLEARAALEAGAGLFAGAGMDLGRYAGIFWAAALKKDSVAGEQDFSLSQQRIEALGILGAGWPESADGLRERLAQELLRGISKEARVRAARLAAAAEAAGADLRPETARALTEKFAPARSAIGGVSHFGRQEEADLDALEAGSKAAMMMERRLEARRVAEATGPAAGSRKPAGM